MEKRMQNSFAQYLFENDSKKNRTQSHYYDASKSRYKYIGIILCNFLILLGFFIPIDVRCFHNSDQSYRYTVTIDEIQLLKCRFDLFTIVTD